LAESIALSKFKTLKDLRKIHQFRRKAQSERRKIYTLDSEATPQGDMLLLADNEGNSLKFDKITPENVLKFLFHKRYETAWCFFWNLHYDARIILRMLLKELSEKQLMKFYRTFRLKAYGFSIHYLEKKKLVIRKGHHSVNFFDIAQFYFEKGLANTYEKNIKKLPRQYLEMKSKREIFSINYYKRHKKQIRKYCIQDCIYTKELSEHWIDMFKEAFEFYPSHWISSGYLAEKVLINNDIFIPKFDEIPEAVQEIAWNSYIGGRIELVERGYTDYACIIDLNSAYPYAFSTIPDLTKGKWIQSKRIEKNALVGFFKIKCNIPNTKHICPFPFVVKSKVVYPVGEFITFVTLAELQACENPCWYEILDSWQFCEAKPYYPYRKIINEWYDFRQELKRKGNPLEQPFKVILNSIYGKTGQRVNGRIGNIFNPALASTITGISRSLLYDFIIKNGIEKDVVMMHTDSICCKKKLDVNSKKLGEFSLDFEGSVYALQSGFYSKNGKWKSRGIGQLGDDTILHKDTFVDEKGRIKYSFDKVRVGTIKRNILEGTIDKIGRFEKQTKNLNINADRGRMWWGRLTDVRKKEHNVSTPFDLSVFEYSKI